MKAIRSTESPSKRGPAEWFSGEVWMQPLVGADSSPSQRSLIVYFAAGARNAWHTHPRGQLLYIISGICLAQTEGGEVQRFSAGEAIWFEPNEKHWHGAAPNHPMVHLAVQEADEHGETVVWLEQFDN